MKNKIDLSKIKVKEVPTKKITANLDGESKEYEIHALTDLEKSCLVGDVADDRNPLRIRNIYILLLSCGIDGLTSVTAELLLNSEFADEARRVGDAIYELSFEFSKAKADEVEKAEKNSERGATVSK